MFRIETLGIADPPDGTDLGKSSKIRLHGATVALIGPVNAENRSLFNHLVGDQRALVSDRPGTTRDVVERGTLLDGMDITFFDTAGEGGTDDDIEQAGIGSGTKRECRSRSAFGRGSRQPACPSLL